MSRLYDHSPRWVDDRVKEMRETDRYPEMTILKGKGYILVSEDAFRDYLYWKDAIEQGREIPPYVIPAETPEKVYLRGVETR